MNAGRVLAAAVFIAFGFGSTVEAAVWNAADDFSVASNPNGDWSYGYRVGTGGTFIPYTSSGTFSGIDFWFLDGTGLPDVGHNDTAAPIGFFQPGDLQLHPGNTVALQSHISDVRWTAPTADTYSVSVAFTATDTRGPEVFVNVYVDGVPFFVDTLSGTGDTTSVNFASLDLNAGSIIDFLVGHNGASPGDHDFTKLDAIITSASVSVLEPGTLTLIAAGVFGLAAFRRRRPA
jgi:hypothetical protein